MFKFDSITNNLPQNTPPNINNDHEFNTQQSNKQIPIIHINNLTINVSPSNMMNCLKNLVQPENYDNIPHKKKIYNSEYDKAWFDDHDNYNYNCCDDITITPSKRINLDLRPYNKKCGKLTPRQYNEITYS